jgi:hypothetical protein
MAGQHRATKASTGIAASGTGGRHRAEQRHSDAYVWLGTGAITLGLGAALATGSGVAQADTGSVSNGPRVSTQNGGAATSSIRTVVSAHTVRSSSPSESSLETSTAKPTSFVSVKQSIVRQQGPAQTGLVSDNDKPAADSGLVSKLLGLDGGEPGLDSGVPGLNFGPSIPFIELGGGGGGGGLVSKIAGALTGGLL